MPNVTELEMRQFIATQLPDNKQRLISPEKLRSVLELMLDFGDLDNVTARGQITNQGIVLNDQTMLSFVVPGTFVDATDYEAASLDGSQVTAPRSWLLPDEDGTLATREWVLASVSGGGGGAAVWGTISGVLSNQTDLQTALNAKAAVSHTHAIDDVTGLQTALDGKQAAGSYAAATHTHVANDITNFGGSVRALLLTGYADGANTALAATDSVLQAFGKLQGQVNARAAATHSHAITDVTGLQTALDGKAAVSHTHTVAELTDFPSQTGNSGKYLTTDGSALSWATVAGGGSGVDTMAAVGSSPNANGASISGTTLTLQPADGSNPGVVTTAAQTFSGDKSFNGFVNIANGSSIVFGSSASNPGLTQSKRIVFDSSGGETYDIRSSAASNMVFNVPTGKRVDIHSGNYTGGTPNIMSADANAVTFAAPISGNVGQLTNTTSSSSGLVSGSNQFGFGFSKFSGSTFGTVVFAAAANRIEFIMKGSSSLGSSTATALITQTGLVVYGTSEGSVNGGSGASSALTVQSTTQGFLMPRMTTAQRNAISSPATGLMVYTTDATATDSSTGVLQVYNGSTWKNCW